MTPRATTQDGTYPRPMMLREHWTDLTGTWQLAYDDDRVGQAHAWHRHQALDDRTRFARDITVPFPPESPASGVGDTSHHAVVWYRRALRIDDLDHPDAAAALRRGDRLVLRFGAVDYAATVWVDGHLVAEHTGGHTPFSADVTDLLDPADAEGEHVVVVRAVDEPTDAAQPRGKQDWEEPPHVIWYERTTGIWQPVWAEIVPDVAVEALCWVPDVVGQRASLALTLSAPPASPLRLRVRLAAGGTELADVSVTVREQRSETTLPLPALANHQAREKLLWRPGRPTLVDAVVTLCDAEGATLDEVSSYLGLRTTAAADGAFRLSGRPIDVRSVLAQNYWPSSHLAAPSARALRREVELVAALGFNAVRVHQKVEDPRFLHWCDRLGVMVWGEVANAFEFSATAVNRLTREWLEVLERDASHPSIVTWVPLNESWGVGDIATSPAQRSFATALAELTRAIDPTRPVVSNDGWEHTDSDLLTVHDYAATGVGLSERYGSLAAITAVLDGAGPAGAVVALPHRRTPRLTPADAPVMLTEFGGVRYEPDADPLTVDGASWGYSTARDADDFARRVADLYDAVRASPVLVGSCWTQLTDTVQEANGLLRADRTPKIPIEALRAIITGIASTPPGRDAQ